MEQTLGKRITRYRKGLGMTQDQLASRLGVTAQAVSKWENDQSCPDITMLPKLSEVFGISSDILLGIREQEEVLVPEVVAPPQEKEKKKGHKAEFEYIPDRKSTMGFALWVLVTGGLLLASTLLHWGTSLWDILWPSAILAFGITGVVDSFSFFSLCCALFGGFFLLCNLNLLPPGVDKSLLFPVLLILFGLSLLVKAFRKPIKAAFAFNLEGDGGKESSAYTEDEEKECFFCKSGFGEDHVQVTLSTLRSGKVEMSFGEMTLDLTTCGQIANDCALELNCSFGELQVRVPRSCRVICNREGSLSSVEYSGSPDPNAETVIRAACTVNCGEIKIRYI